ncbi:hypothetical protein VB711_10090, partial [Cronbergia sp. UHCC 0137]|uniref:hypothetical protein n=1 Tax=Cronbergia sp. UHCC 0137 TaxID=3110239 RepID=UPI002B20252B
ALPSNSQIAIALLHSPKSDRTPFNSPTAIAPPQPPKQRSHPFNFPNILFYLIQSRKGRGKSF